MPLALLALAQLAGLLLVPLGLPGTWLQVAAIGAFAYYTRWGGGEDLTAPRPVGALRQHGHQRFRGFMRAHRADDSGEPARHAGAQHQA